jgi:Ca2+-binding RTX toxin-like protein
MMRRWNEHRHFWLRDGHDYSVVADDAIALRAAAAPDRWMGTDETWTGGSGDDVHNGTNGDDTLDGDDGNDIINARQGDDTITGGAGDDELYGGQGNDIFYGGDDNDTLHVGQGTDQVYAGDGDDTIAVDAEGGIISGMNGDLGFDVFDASNVVGGTLSVSGVTGVEKFILTPNADVFGGLAGSEIYEGGDGNDTLYGGAGDDTLRGQKGDDVLFGDAANDEIDGGKGFDIGAFTAATSPVTASLKAGTATGYGSDTLVDIEALVGGPLADTLTGDRKDNDIAGYPGDDILNGGGGSDDEVFYNSTSGGVTVDLAAGTASGALGNDTLKNFENIMGSLGADDLSGDGEDNEIEAEAGDDMVRGRDGDDDLFGWEGNDELNGGAGDDFLGGNDGDDILLGGGGIDTMDGGDGADTFKFGALAPGNVPDNFIEDLESADTIDLSDIDANVNKDNDQAFKLVESLTGRAAQAALAFNGNNTILRLDTDGDGEANFRIVIAGEHGEGDATFIL